MQNKSELTKTIDIIDRYEKGFNDPRVKACVQTHVLWPCLEWTITIPVRPRAIFDVFARLILNLAKEGVTPKPEHYPVALSADLLKLVTEELVRKGWLTRSLQLSDIGRSLLDQDCSIEPNPIVATVFTDLHSGKLLPFIIEGIPVYCLGKYKGEEKVVYRMQGSDKDYRSGYIFPAGGEIGVGGGSPPSPSDIKRAYREHKRNFRQYSNNELKGRCAPPEMLDSSIDISSKPKEVYLACHAIVPVGNQSDLLVTDGFGLWFSADFAERLKSANPEWWRAAKKKAVEQGYTTRSVEKDGCYSKISRLWKDIYCQKKQMDAIGDAIDISSGQIGKYYNTYNKVLGLLYDVMEGAWAQVVQDFDRDAVEIAVEQLNNIQDYYEKCKYVMQCSSSLGFECEGAESFFEFLPPGKFKSVLEKKSAEMGPLMALAMTIAIGNDNREIRILGEQNPGMFSMLRKLKELRNSAKHADVSKSVDEKQKDLIDGLYRSIRNIVCTLQPKIVTELKSIENDTNSIELGSEETVVLQCWNILESHFEGLTLMKMPQELKDRLVRLTVAEIEAREKGETGNRLYVVYAATAVETALRLACNVSPQQMRGDVNDMISLAALHLVGAGFYSDIGDVPLGALGGKGKKTDENFRKVMLGGSATLGIYTLVLSYLNPEKLIELHSLYPGSIDLILQLIEQRGHGNWFELEDRCASIDTKEVYKLIQSITKIFIIPTLEL